MPKAKPQSLARHRDIRKAVIEADLVDTALRDSAFTQREATPQVLLRSREANKAKNNMVVRPGQDRYDLN